MTVTVTNALSTHIEKAVQAQEDAMEAAFTDHIQPQIQALDELQSGRRLVMERNRRNSKLTSLKNAIHDLQQRNNPYMDSSKTDTPGSHKVQVWTKHTTQRSAPKPTVAKKKPKALTFVKARQPHTTALVTPVGGATCASPGDWFEDADIW